MPEEVTTEQVTPAPPEGNEPEPKVFDAEYVDKLRKEAAKYRTEAKANAEAAKKLAELEDANKSEVEKANERAAQAEREAEQARADALRLRIAAKHGISDPDDIDLFLTGTDEDTLTKQAERLAERSENRKKNGNVVPKEGSTTQPKDDELRDFTRRLFTGSEP